MPAGYVIDMIDVGQGDAFIIATRTTTGVKNCLIDAGRKRAGAKIVKHLEKHYKGKLTYAVLSHIDDDHIGGFRSVLDAGIHPEIVFVNDPRDAINRFVKSGATLLREQLTQINASITTSDDIIAEIDRLKIERRSAFAGESLSLSSALTVDFLSPDRSAFPNLVSRFSKRNREKLSERSDDERRTCTAENEASVVCTATYDIDDLYDRALFTGDACLKTLKRVAGGAFDYVKAPHHGSWHCCDDDLVETWTDGEKEVRAAFSFGENSHGHPDEEVLSSFRSRDAKILCTHCHGTVQSRRAGATNIGTWNKGLGTCDCG